MRRLVLALCLLGCGGEPSDPLFCTEIGCTDGLTLRLLAPDAGFVDGAYVATVTLGEDSSTCEWQVDGVPSGECEATVFTAGEIAITFGETPDSVTYSITRDGNEVAAETLMPMYEVVQPNGPGCEPTCRQVAVAIQL